MKAETIVDEGQKTDAEPIQDEDSDNEVEERLAFWDAFDIHVRGHTRRL
jgi:hypothetical protein